MKVLDAFATLEPFDTVARKLDQTGTMHLEVFFSYPSVHMFSSKLHPHRTAALALSKRQALDTTQCKTALSSSIQYIPSTFLQYGSSLR